MGTLWKVENLTKEFEIRSEFKKIKVTALKSINLEIYKGEILGLAGESGSGKTTLGKVIIRLIDPDKGKIIYRDIDITKLPERVLRKYRKNFQIIFQDPYKSLNPRIPVGLTVMEGITGNKKERYEKAVELLNLVGIKEKRFYDYPHQFSGGERQRIAITRALSTEPEFIVCDEPTSNLDVSIQGQILNLFIELKEKFNLTYLFISHNLKIIRFLADRVGIMYKGEIVEMGKTEEIFENPKHSYTQKLIESSFAF
ncbi:MAG: ATP-binding cassette domain-containing protein [Candidatus Omnitrophica bacterium]|nr:ATP-binding cassette domain-containing protein [Candidatus Omnitrophota bacterium]MCM8802154.1 ATP-binding cassette domain-containing protein [Candidatus Omnitrophota bacterium]